MRKERHYLVIVKLILGKELIWCHESVKIIGVKIIIISFEIDLVPFWSINGSGCMNIKPT